MASNSSVSLFSLIACFMTPPHSFIVMGINMANVVFLVPLCAVFLVPLCAVVLCDGIRRFSSSAALSHSYCFSCHMALIELIGAVGSGSCLLGIWVNDAMLVVAGILISIFTWFGQISIHVLTCVERHLAAVHPVVYLRLRGESGIRIRNVGVGCVWLLCAAGTSLTVIGEIFAVVVVDHVLLTSALIVVSFCSVSVLFVLIRPGPGEQGGNRERVDQSKRRAFYTIVTILGALLLKFTGSLLWVGFYASGQNVNCILFFTQILLGLPSSLVSPLLFLHRKGKLVCCRRKTQ